MRKLTEQSSLLQLPNVTVLVTLRKDVVDRQLLVTVNLPRAFENEVLLAQKESVVPSRPVAMWTMTASAMMMNSVKTMTPRTGPLSRATGCSSLVRFGLRW